MNQEQEQIIKRSTFRQNLINIINNSGLSAFEIEAIFKPLYLEIITLKEKEEAEAIKAYNEQQQIENVDKTFEIPESEDKEEEN